MQVISNKSVPSQRNSIVIPRLEAYSLAYIPPPLSSLFAGSLRPTNTLHREPLPLTSNGLRDILNGNLGKGARICRRWKKSKKYQSQEAFYV